MRTKKIDVSASITRANRYLNERMDKVISENISLQAQVARLTGEIAIEKAKSNLLEARVNVLVAKRDKAAREAKNAEPVRVNPNSERLDDIYSRLRETEDKDTDTINEITSGEGLRDPRDPRTPQLIKDPNHIVFWVEYGVLNFRVSNGTSGSQPKQGKIDIAKDATQLMQVYNCATQEWV